MSSFVLLWLSRVKQQFVFKNYLFFENENYTNPGGTLKWWSGGLFEVIIKGSKVSEGPASRSRPPRFDLSRSHADMTSEFFEVKLTAQKVLSSAAKWWTHEHSSSTWILKTVQIWTSNFRKYQWIILTVAPSGAQTFFSEKRFSQNLLVHGGGPTWLIISLILE